MAHFTATIRKNVFAFLLEVKKHTKFLHSMVVEILVVLPSRHVHCSLIDTRFHKQDLKNYQTITIILINNKK